MEKHELERKANVIKGKILDKIEEYLDDDVVDIDSIGMLGKLYTRVDKGW